MTQKQYRPHPKLWNKLKPAVKQLRSEATQAEAQLWELLRGRRLNGYKFRRQHVIDRFVVDFFCDQAHLIIELDGSIHKKQVLEDQERQVILEGMGFQVLRFTNDQILYEMPQVLAQIVDRLKPTHPPSPA